MKRLLVFLLVLAVALAGLYVWWQRNATRVITGEVQKMARGFFTNPEKLKVENAPVKMTGLHSALVPKLVISGEDLVVRDGPRVSRAKLVLQNIDIEGPPFRIAAVGSGYYDVTTTDTAITNYVKTRGISFHSLVRIPLDTVSVLFTPKSTTVGAYVELPGGKKLQLKAIGSLVPASANGQVDFRVRDLKPDALALFRKPVTEALGMMNPVVDISRWPLQSDIVHISTGMNTVNLRGRITGITPQSLL